MSINNKSIEYCSKEEKTDINQDFIALI